MSEDQMQLVRYEVEDGVAVITVDNPPLNALAPGMREGIVAATERANEDAEVHALVLIGAGRNFIAGADIRRFGGVRPVSTRTSAAALDASQKPVIAAIDGYALGGGFEHTLACHYRIATPCAKLGLPEVNLGLIPGGGGTQRLPRLIGAEAALDLITKARQVLADEALRLGLVDAVLDDTDFRAAAVRYARSVAAARPLRRVRDLTVPPPPEGFFDAARKSLARAARHVPAPLHALACIEAAVSGSFEDGLALEEKLFAELESSDTAKALRYAFFAEREVAKIPGLQGEPAPEPVRSAAVIGAGTMGSGIAMAFADAGIAVKVLEISADALERGMQRVRDTYATSVKRGRLTQAQLDERLSLISGVTAYADIADCDAVVEAVFEHVDLKKQVFATLDAVMKPDALLLTNSSAIDIDVMAQATKRPGSVAGAHFFAPANVMKLCEVVRGTHTAPATVARTMKMAKDMRKIAAVAGSCDGFAANRSRTPMMTELMLMLEEGALPQEVDRVMVEFGYPMGPFAVNDMSGLDVSYEGRKRRAAADPSYRKLHVPDRLVEMGRKGQKTGAGWYRYDEGDRTPHPDDTVKTVIADVAREFNIEQRIFTPQDILHRLLFASVNEACKILAEGKANRASDIDAMWLHGFGFPRHRGGLMYWADTVGADAIYRQIGEWHARYGKRWQPAALLEEAARSGERLRDLIGRVERPRSIGPQGLL